MITHYKKQTCIQKEVMRLRSLFIPNWNVINKVRDGGLDVYNVGATLKQKVGIGLIGFCVICPATMNFILIPAIYKICLGGLK